MSVLCLCYRNTAQSAMMEFILKDMACARGMDLAVESAGTFPGLKKSTGSMEPQALAELARRGIDGSEHRTRHLETIGGLDRFRYILCSTDSDGHVARLVLPVELAHKTKVVRVNGHEIDTPIHGDDEAYRHCADLIVIASSLFLDRLLKAEAAFM